MTQRYALPGELDELLTAACDGDAATVQEERSNRIGRALAELDTTREVLPVVDAAVRQGFASDANAVEHLAALVAAGEAGQRAKHALVLANLGLVHRLAKHYTGHATPLAELVQEGSIALLRAVELFDHQRGLRFSTYAVWWIRNAFYRCISEQTSAVRAPLEVLRGASKLNRAVWSIYGRTGEMPSPEQLAEHLGETAESLERMASAGNTRTISLDGSLVLGGTATLLDQLVDTTPNVESTVSDAMLRAQLERSLGRLPGLEAMILRRKFGFADGVETPLSVIARDFCLSYERANQLSRQAMRRLRHDLMRSGITDAC